MSSGSRRKSFFREWKVVIGYWSLVAGWHERTWAEQTQLRDWAEQTRAERTQLRDWAERTQLRDWAEQTRAEQTRAEQTQLGVGLRQFSLLLF